MSTYEESAVEANEAFYRAFARRDAPAMRALWSTRHLVACVHPGWQILYGHAEVMASWDAILDNPAAPRIRCSEARAVVVGDTAVVTCTESIRDSELVATNVFVREGHEWKMIHHQAGPFARRARKAVSPDLN